MGGAANMWGAPPPQQQQPQPLMQMQMQQPTPGGFTSPWLSAVLSNPIPNPNS
jgi:hypothetical protein